MHSADEAHQRLSSIPSLQIMRDEPLSRHTRFGLGGPALLFADTEAEEAFVAAVRLLKESALPWTVIGGGTNLIVSDAGFPGVVLRYRGAGIAHAGLCIEAGAGALLQDVVDDAIGHGLKGIEQMTGIPGYLGAAVYGNAGAYGRSISDMLASVRFFDGDAIRETGHDGCAFRYRSSVFKQRKDWFILSCRLQMAAGDPEELRRTADGIREIRDRKYPPSMMCAGSIFKNQLLDALPESARAVTPPEIVKGGKAPTAWYLEQVGAKGLTRGGVRVTGAHANTLYNAGGGTAKEFCELVAELKQRVFDRFGIVIEEEVQYLGFDGPAPGEMGQPRRGYTVMP